MSTRITIFLSLFLTQIIYGFDVEVKVFDDDGHEEDWSHLYSEEGQTTADRTGVAASKHHITKRRASFGGYEQCMEHHSKTSGYQQFAESVYLGSEIRLFCHVCEHAGHDHGPWLWFHFEKVVDRSFRKTEWIAREVNLDLNRELKKNRVYVTPEHELVIKDFRPGDAGTYFCEKFEKGSDDFTKFGFVTSSDATLSSAAMGLALKSIAKTLEIDVLHHVDVIKEKTITLVSNEEGSTRTPSSPVESKIGNWKAETLWQEWGRCDACYGEGEKRRVGSCIVTKLDSTVEATDDYMSHVLELYPEGADCASSLFAHIPAIANYPNEIEVEECEPTDPCPESLRKDDDKMKRSSQVDSVIDGETFKAEPTVTKSSMWKRVGDKANLPCIGSLLDTTIVWKNGTHKIKMGSIGGLSAGRVSIDAYNNLRISHVVKQDQGKYTCEWDGFPRVEIQLHVEKSRQETVEDIIQYFVYLMLYLSFLFFITLSGIVYHAITKPKNFHKNKKRQLQKRAEEKQKLLSASSSENE